MSQDQEIAQKYVDGETIEKLAYRYCTTIHRIRAALKATGTETRPTGTRVRENNPITQHVADALRRTPKPPLRVIAEEVGLTIATVHWHKKKAERYGY